MKKQILGLAAAVSGIAVLATTPASASVTFGSANVHSNALASSTAGANKNGNGSGSDADVATAYEPTLDASAFASAEVGASKGVRADAQVSEDASATFASPAQGTIDFSGQVMNTVTGASGEAQGQDDGEYYNYTFNVSSPSEFNLSYDFAETYLDVNNSYILIDDTTNSVVSQLNTGGNSSGSVSLALAAGSYALGASTEYGDFAYQSGIGASTGSHNEDYAFSIASAAPEPASWMLMILGLGGLGLALRTAKRQSRTTSLAY